MVKIDDAEVVAEIADMPEAVSEAVVQSSLISGSGVRELDRL